MTKKELLSKLRANNLLKYFKQIEPLIRNTIRLYPISCNESKILIGQTKIGGKPDLPPNFSWFTETHITQTVENVKNTTVKPLSFIAQINLSEISHLDTENILPKSGMIYFFYSLNSGYNIEDKNKFKVIFYEGDLTILKRVNFPKNLEKSNRFKPCKVILKQEISLPDYDNIFSDNEQMDKLYEVIYEYDSINKIFGYSDNIQEPMELLCQQMLNSFYFDISKEYNQPKEKEIETNAMNWLLLLQIDSNENSNMMWVDDGKLYFWIIKDNLQNKEFDKAWCFTQFH